MNINELEKLKTEMEKNHKANIAAIDHVLLKLHEEAKKPATVVHIPWSGERMSKIVERIIANFVGNFEIYDISCKYEEETGGRVAGPNVRREISNVINKLKHRKPPEIIVVQPGKGSRSGIYAIKTN